MKNKKYTDEERELLKGHCYDCYIIYSDFVDLIVSDEIWEKINPTYYEGAGLLCPNCIGLRLRKLEIIDVKAVIAG